MARARNLKADSELYQALRTLALGATVEEIGRDESGVTKVFKRKLAPDFNAIKYIYEQGSNGIEQDDDVLKCTAWVGVKDKPKRARTVSAKAKEEAK